MNRSLLYLSFLLASIAHGKTKPNILFIYTDDHSHRTISCYPEAYPWVKTPNIDALAANGVRFASAYVGTWCMPSRATLLTGHHQHGVESMRMVGKYPGSEYDPEKCPFWPKVFRKYGYQTAHVGKWHTGTDTGADASQAKRGLELVAEAPRGRLLLLLCCCVGGQKTTAVNS